MIDVVVISVRQEATGIRSFELARADGADLPPFSAGSHIDVHLPDGLIRQYSLCNPGALSGYYQIGVLLEPASRGGSKAMHQLQVGDRLQISEPRNLFALDPGSRRSLLFAGGIGITPILAMAQELAKAGDDFECHYSVRSRDRAAFTDWFRQPDLEGRVHVHMDEGGGERLDAERVLASPTPDTHLYVCGPPGYIEYVLGVARNLGWPDANLHREYFSATEDTAHQADDGSFEVKIASTGQVIAIPADQTVAEALERQGIEIPLSCEQGICGTCLTRVLDGVPDHRDLFLSEAEQAANDQFTPCCSRALSDQLVIDL
ncbi:oxidoreductase [Marinobacter halodurans]|uniref:Oxidoreductase n=1 Tax=Marinobacter halodurans TaxID=2528979 RepID=A0ABY1ZQD3_9GAMM|nr:PDR/VanB family oxidoreductase [Marinobacter halodurans]TBW56479.1 oxidoreductase [Marinobacter halodurans]